MTPVELRNKAEGVILSLKEIVKPLREEEEGLISKIAILKEELDLLMGKVKDIRELIDGYSYNAGMELVSIGCPKIDKSLAIVKYTNKDSTYKITDPNSLLKDETLPRDFLDNFTSFPTPKPKLDTSSLVEYLNSTSEERWPENMSRYVELSAPHTDVKIKF